jgi:hypothetical protein
MGKPPRSKPIKMPPAPSVTERSAGSNVRAEIVCELYGALLRLGADDDLLAVIGCWGATLSDAEVLLMLREYNATGRVLEPPEWNAG